MKREQVLRDYMQAWLDNDSSRLGEFFTQDCLYRECFGPRYLGLKQIQQWFVDWQEKGRVHKWEVERLFSCGDTVIASWTFACCYEDQEHTFDGVTIADFEGNQIAALSEYSSQIEALFPYQTEI